MQKFIIFFILVFLLAHAAKGQVTGFGVQFGAEGSKDSSHVYIIQEQRGSIPEGGWQTVQTVRDMPNASAAEALVQAQMKAADSEMERLVKIKKDLTQVSEAIAKKKTNPEVPASKKRPEVVKKE